MPKRIVRPSAMPPPEPEDRVRRASKRYDVEERALAKVRKKPMTRSKTPKPPSRTKRTTLFRTPKEGWRRWIALEALTVLAGLAAGFGIAAALLWVRAKEDVAGYLANPPRPVPSIVWSAPTATIATWSSRFGGSRPVA